MPRQNPRLSVPLTVEQVRRLRECETVFFDPHSEHGLTRAMLHELLAVWLRFRWLRWVYPCCKCADCRFEREIARRKEAQGAIEEQFRAATEGRND